jgi:cytidine deaminase
LKSERISPGPDFTAAGPLERLLKGLPETGRRSLRELLSDDFRGIVSREHIALLANQMSFDVDQLVTKLVPLASLYAWAAISRYAVGGVALGASGAAYFGANFEPRGLPLNLVVHAEQSTINNAWLSGEQSVKALALSAAPCGHCRQFLFELEDSASLQILWTGTDGSVVSRPLGELLPSPFGPQHLGIPGSLMMPQSHRLKLPAESSSPTLRKALSAANGSYAPYTRAYAGVALRGRTGQFYLGCYAENAAFNPSISPMSSAVARWIIATRGADPIEEAALVARGSKVDHVTQARWVLSTITPEPLQVYSFD